MQEIRIHGRGGQGSLVLAQLMAIAALHDGRYGQAFPFLGGGGERRGKPIVAFCRLSDQPIRIRCRIREPHYLIIQDATITREMDVTEGMRDGGVVLINTDGNVEELGLRGSLRAYSFAAGSMARGVLGRPLINTALLGAFAAISEELSLDAVTGAVMSRFPGELGAKNAKLVQESYRLFMRDSR